MTSAPAEPHPWPLRRWGAMIALVFGAQLGLILWLGTTAPIRPRPATAAFTLSFAGAESEELRALDDPTLFILPHAQGFSGPVWLTTPRSEFRTFEWSVPTNQRSLPLEKLGTAFNPSVESSDLMAVHLPNQLEASPTIPDLPPRVFSTDRSVLQLEGDLAERRLLTPLELKSQQYSAILTNSVVQLVVDADGRPVSPPVLLSSCGWDPADQYALRQARTVRFEPVYRDPAKTASDPASDLDWGKLVFRWRTIPIPLTNAPAVSQ